jgi:phosphoglycerol transferase MdoB-like AlkP superfamily enzyme
MDSTINELFLRALKLTEAGFVPIVADGTIARASAYIHPTENYTLFDGKSLYRRTHSFSGDVAFDVRVNDSNPPNVVVIAVESFRFHDSHYLVGEDDPSNLFKGWNGTVVPNFDRWARRGVALPNLWSSWKTSRSVASLLYAQIPYDSTQTTDTTGGRADVELAGMPQLFKQKGYDTFFTTGTHTSYDD